MFSRSHTHFYRSNCFSACEKSGRAFMFIKPPEEIAAGRRENLKYNENSALPHYQ